MKNRSKISLNIVAMIIFLSSCADAQQSIKEKSWPVLNPAILHIGDKIPDRFFAVNQFRDKHINLSDLKGKVVLLDIWGTYCGACIEHMPDEEILQKKFKDSLQVIMVTGNSNAQVKHTAMISDNVKNCKLPFINGKDQLAAYFDPNYLPKYVWIDTKGIIQYITNDQFSDDTVKRILAGTKFSVNEKKSLTFSSYDVPVMMNLYPVFGNNFYIYSYLAPDDETRYKYNFGGKSSLFNNFLPKTEMGTFAFKDLYKAAYGYQVPQDPLPDDRVIVNFKDSANYSKSGRRYVYEIIVHKNIPEKRLRKYMQSEFDLFFDVSSHLEKRMVPCIIFKQINNGHSCFTNEKDTSTYDLYGDKMLRASVHWKTLFGHLNFSDLTPPHTLIDETGISLEKVVKLNMSIDFGNIEKVNKSLAPYGLTAIREDRLMDCIVIE